MQQKLKNVLKFYNDKLFLLAVFLNVNFVFSQNVTFNFSDNQFIIKKNELLIYKDSSSFRKGSCNYVDIYSSRFNNQFYLYIENTCTSSVSKQLFKVNYINSKFRVICKESIEINRNEIKTKKEMFDDFIIDSLTLDKLTIEDSLILSKSSKKIDIPFFYKNKLIGVEKVSKDDVIFNYPIIENYENINLNTNLYNDIAYLLYLNKSFDEAIYILKKVIEKSPKRIVAYLNIADCYWETYEKEKAKENYKKYIQLMKDQKKDLKQIPKYVLERIK